MGLREQMRERERKSLARYGVSNVMDQLVKLRDQMADDPAKKKLVASINSDLEEAALYVLQADEAYEIVSRSIDMLKQMEAGDWPVSELPGLRKALEVVQKKLL